MDDPRDFSTESKSDESEIAVHPARSGIATSAQTMTPREDWMFDNAVVKRLLENVDAGSPAGLASLLAVESGRVLEEVRKCDSWESMKMSRPSRERGGSAGVRSTLFDTWDASEREPIWQYCRFKFPLNPHSLIRLIWDFIGLALVIYDAVTIPLMLMVFPPGTDLGKLMPIVSCTFWTLDIGVSCMTAIVVDGEQKDSWKEIWRQYARSWLAMDVLMVLPDWIWVSMDNDRGGFALLRIVKAIRALRLLRVVKFADILREQLKRVNSETLLKTVSLLQLIFAFMMLNHFTACGWYLVGKTTGDGWFQEMVLITAESASAGYLLALHWSITQFHGSMEVIPGNTSERIFAVIMLIVGMLTFSVTVSVSMDMIFQVRQARKRDTERKRRLRSYFIRHDVPMKLMLSVKAHLKLCSDTDKQLQDDKELLEALPPQLGRALLLEVRQPTLDRHWFFTWIKSKHFTAFQEVCSLAFVSIPALHGHNIFTCQDACSSMYFVESGSLRYLAMKSGKAAQRTSIGPHSRFVKRLCQFNAGVEVARKQWVCEPALWVQSWRTHGELIALVNTVVLSLESSDLAEVISAFPWLYFDVSVYAHWVVQELKDYDGDLLVDLWMPATTSGLGGGSICSEQRGEYA